MQTVLPVEAGAAGQDRLAVRALSASSELLLDTVVSPSFPSCAGTSVLDTPVEDSCGSFSFFGAQSSDFQTRHTSQNV